MRDRKVAKEKLQGKYSERFKDELLCLDQNDYKNYLAQIRTRDGRTVTSCIKKIFPQSSIWEMEHNEADQDRMRFRGRGRRPLAWALSEYV